LAIPAKAKAEPSLQALPPLNIPSEFSFAKIAIIFGLGNDKLEEKGGEMRGNR
jgi:hypothetical protein